MMDGHYINNNGIVGDNHHNNNNNNNEFYNTTPLQSPGPLPGLISTSIPTTTTATVITTTSVVETASTHPSSAASSSSSDNFASTLYIDTKLYNNEKLLQLSQIFLKRDQLLYQYHTTICGGLTFHVPMRYQIIEPVGKGGFGCVVSAFDQITGEKVAIKKIVNLFEREKHFQKKILREVKILQHLRNHDNIVCIKDLIMPPNYEQFADVYIVTNLMDFDLNRLLRRDNQPFTEQSIQYFIHQILRGLKYIHSAEIIHRDLKPENILLNQEIDVMICDFGLSRGISHGEYPDESKYVVTRWYRAPEVILFWDQLSKAIDVWSVGCIFAELLSKPPRQIFFRGNNFKDQLDIILKKCGTPRDPSELKGCEAGLKYYYDHYSNIYYSRIDLQSVFPDANPLAIDLLDKMLQIDPNKRITVDEALAHPYLELMHDEEDEIECEKVFGYGFSEDTSVEMIKKLVFDELVAWYTEQRRLEMEERKKQIEMVTLRTSSSTGTRSRSTSVDGMDTGDDFINIDSHFVRRES